jgi:hypothetical protein
MDDVTRRLDRIETQMIDGFNRTQDSIGEVVASITPIVSRVAVCETKIDDHLHSADRLKRAVYTLLGTLLTSAVIWATARLVLMS